MIIDVHTHAWPEKVSGRARENLEKLFRVKLVADPTVDTLRQYMARNGIRASVVCAVATRPDQVVSINDWAFGIRAPDIRVFAALHPEFSEWKSELTRIRERADGVKFQPEFQNFYVDDEKVFPVYAEMEKLGLPVLFHCGEELSGTMLVRSSGKRIRAVRDRFPGLKIVAAHFGGFRRWEETREYLLGQDIYLDTSYFFDYFPPEEARKMLLSHRADRLLFGTDFPLVDQAKDRDILLHLEIPESLKQKIFYRNAGELLGI